MKPVFKNYTTPILCMVLALLGIDAGLTGATGLQAQIDEESGANTTEGAGKGGAAKGGSAEANAEDDNIIKPPPPVPAKKKVYSPEEVRKQCAKYEGRFIAFYGEVFKVEKCRRRPVLANETVFKLMQSGAQIAEVPAVAIAAIPEGASIDIGTTEASARQCSVFHGKYVTYSYSDVYYVEKCTRFLIPDYETFVTHHKTKAKSAGEEILSLSWTEFSGLKVGEDIPSILNKEYAALLEMGPPVDVIPVDEACAGLNGKMVSFYSRIYRIEKCRKREADPEYFLRKNMNAKLQELKPEQWLSLPDGVPLEGPAQPGKLEQFDPGAPKDE